MRTDKPIRAAALLLALALGGCSLAPEFSRPEAPVAATLPGEAVADQAGVAAADLGWRDFFVDERLMVAGLGGLIWMSIGALIMAKMINFEI